MPWRCPVCHAEIQHHLPDQLPDPSQHYRCQTCRLGLRFEPALWKMVIAPDARQQGTDEDKGSVSERPKKRP
jgi:hypothetical protein